MRLAIRVMGLLICCLPVTLPCLALADYLPPPAIFTADATALAPSDGQTVGPNQNFTQASSHRVSVWRRSVQNPTQWAYEVKNWNDANGGYIREAGYITFGPTELGTKSITWPYMFITPWSGGVPGTYHVWARSIIGPLTDEHSNYFYIDN